jgi:hypothetical protein
LHEGIKTRIKETAIAIKDSSANVQPDRPADPFIDLFFLTVPPCKDLKFAVVLSWHPNATSLQLFYTLRVELVSRGKLFISDCNNHITAMRIFCRVQGVPRSYLELKKSRTSMS